MKELVAADGTDDAHPKTVALHRTSAAEVADQNIIMPAWVEGKSGGPGRHDR